VENELKILKKLYLTSDNLTTVFTDSEYGNCEQCRHSTRLCQAISRPYPSPWRASVACTFEVASFMTQPLLRRYGFIPQKIHISTTYLRFYVPTCSQRLSSGIGRMPHASASHESTSDNAHGSLTKFLFLLIFNKVCTYLN
jgi:hypothetical protein